MQFSRYLPLCLEKFSGGVSLVAGQQLRSLLRRSFPGIEILNAVPEDQSAWQWQCPLLSLPLAFKTTIESIPQTKPYLYSDPDLARQWKNRIASLDIPPTKKKIGLVWKTGRALKNASLRSLSIKQLAPLLDLPNCIFFSLQKETDRDIEPRLSAGKLFEWGNEFADFDSTASLLVNMDLVISVDTAVAHLAGGLGVPVWLLNRHAGEWRWLNGRDDSPWYPAMRIFTQKIPGDWDEVVMRVCGEVR